MTYAEKLRDPRWQRKRLEVMQYADFRCQICGSTDRTLNVHHCYYEQGRDPWDYLNGSLLCSCEECHEKIEAFLKRGKSFRMFSVATDVKIPSKPPQFRWAFRIFYHNPDLMANYPTSLGNIAIDAKAALLGLEKERLFREYDFNPEDSALVHRPEEQIEDIANQVVCAVADKAQLMLREMLDIPSVTEKRKIEILNVIQNIRRVKASKEVTFGAEAKAEWMETTFSNEGVLLTFP